jgi:hypothetical protein
MTGDERHGPEPSAIRPARHTGHDMIGHETEAA